ncbi:hypothetical protein [Dactylosporangium sp. NPDC049140]|uniref:hypothetical protein n=1 Tax=Dactylosporangium sp. NPDC049140 TaxID=3155647 RepID=UPI0033FA9965
MIPVVDFDPNPELPREATFWMPSEQDRALGYFHDMWEIGDVSREDAMSAVDTERSAITALDLLAPDAETFEVMARVLEAYGTELPPEDDPADLEMFDLLAAHTSIGMGELEGLEIGVAGLSLALSAIGCVPAASCRSHTGEHSWSYAPVVIFATSRSRAEWLQPLAARCDCGFEVDAARPKLLAVVARSVTDMNRLAATMLAPEVAGQLPLFA